MSRNFFTVDVTNTVCVIPSVLRFCKAFLTCSAGRFADTIGAAHRVRGAAPLVTGTSHQKIKHHDRWMTHSVQGYSYDQLIGWVDLYLGSSPGWWPIL